MGCKEQHLRMKFKAFISAGGQLPEQPRQGLSGDTVFPRHGENHVVVLEGVGSGTLTQFVAFSGTTLQCLFYLFTTTVQGNGFSVLQFWRIPNWLLSLTGRGARTIPTIRGKIWGYTRAVRRRTGCLEPPK